MKRFKKAIPALLTLTLSVSALAGCGQSSPGQGSASPATTATPSAAAGTNQPSETPDTGIRPDTLDKIKVVLFGEESPRMAELMKNEFQQTFIDEINTEVELMYLPWTENGAGRKVDLMIAAGEDFDTAIIDPAWAASSVAKEYLQDLAPVIDTCLPDWKKVMSEEAFKPYTYGDKIYAIPIGSKPSAGVFNTVCVRQDIMDELGMTDISSIEQLDAYVTKAKEKYPNMYATYDIASSEYLVRGAGDRNITSFVTGLWIDQDTKELVNFAESPEFKSVVELYNDWYKRDLIPRDILTNTITHPFQAGMVFYFRGTCGTTVIENEPALKQVIPTAYTREYYLNPEKPIYKNSYENTAFQVPVTSDKADRVALFVNTLQKSTELVDMFIYGVKDKDYSVVNDKIVANQSDELFYQWMIFNVNLSHFDERFPADFIDTYRNWDKEAIPNITYGLAIDYTNIQNEKAQINTVWTELAMPMLSGIVDYNTNYDKLIKALKDAGWDKYVAEIQSQLDAHLAK